MFHGGWAMKDKIHPEYFLTVYETRADGISVGDVLEVKKRGQP